MVSLLKQMICTHHLFDIVDFQESVGSTKKAKKTKQKTTKLFCWNRHFLKRISVKQTKNRSNRRTTSEFLSAKSSQSSSFAILKHHALRSNRLSRWLQNNNEVKMWELPYIDRVTELKCDSYQIFLLQIFFYLRSFSCLKKKWWQRISRKEFMSTSYMLLYLGFFRLAASWRVGKCLILPCPPGQLWLAE